MPHTNLAESQDFYAISSGAHDFYGYPSNPNAISPFGANGLPTTGTVGVEIFNTLPTTMVHHYSLDTQYELGRDWIMTFDTREVFA